MKKQCHRKTGSCFETLTEVILKQKVQLQNVTEAQAFPPNSKSETPLL